MKWLKKREAAPEAPAAVQLRSWERHPFGPLGEYVPLRAGETRLYRAVREAVPVVDAAIYKLIRMCGGLSVRCDSPRTQQALAEFLRTAPAGRGQVGLNAFLDCYLDSLLTCGRAVGEIVPGIEFRDIAAVLCGRVEDIEIREGANPLDFTIWGPGEGGRMEALPCQDLILFTPLNPEAENPYGVSLLRSLPFMADILMKIYHTVGVNWERCGNVRFAVTCQGGEGAAQRGQALAGEWSRAMRETRSRPGFRRRRGCEHPGYRRGRPDPGQSGPRAADSGADCLQNRHPALYAGAELELYGANEFPAGGYADHRNHRPAADADAGGGTDLPPVAPDAGGFVRV